MSFEINKHVTRLNRFQPFNASFAQIYYEYVDQQETERLDTRAFSYLRRMVLASGTRLVVLTGDAGHGKTHLCGRLLADLEGIDEAAAKGELEGKASGDHDLAELPDGRMLRLVKDLSEFEPQAAGRVLADALNRRGTVTVVCANEGRLRSAIAASADIELLAEALDESVHRGSTTVAEGVILIDLNHQSIATPDGNSLVSQLLRTWVEDQRRWRSCGSCDAQPRCPIFENHRLLSSDDALGESRRVAVETLFRVAEQTGHVITIRELLIACAYAITGGLDCPSVHDFVQRRDDDRWQGEHLFHNVIFGDDVPPDQRERLEVFKALRLLDPGHRAIRRVDDTLLPDTGERIGRFLPVVAVEEIGSPRSRREEREEANRHRQLIRFLRRRSFFEAAGREAEGGEMAERLGLRHLGEFESIVGSGLPATNVLLRDRLLRGLEAVQGVRRAGAIADFMVVDPAFAAHRGSASVIATQVLSSDVRVVPQTFRWSEELDREPEVPQSVDWIDRRLWVEVPLDHDHFVGVDLDLRQFEFVLRAAEGLNSRQFFRAEIRRIMRQLAAVAAETAPRGRAVMVLYQGKQRQLAIDVGGLVRVVQS